MKSSKKEPKERKSYFKKKEKLTKEEIKTVKMGGKISPKYKIITVKSPPSLKRKMGRPTKYSPGLCKKIVKFFDVGITEQKSVINENTEKVLYTYSELGKIPTLEGFCIILGIAISTLHEWTKTPSVS